MMTRSEKREILWACVMFVIIAVVALVAGPPAHNFLCLDRPHFH